MPAADELSKKILNHVRQNGPLLPIKIAKLIDKDTLFASAMLASLVSSGQIKMTNVKIGGSQLYYVVGQESKLQDLSKYLHEREKEVYEVLKKNQVLRDVDLKPIQRIALRETKDFAIPIAVKDEDRREIFWKWYLTSDDKAKELITMVFQKTPIKKHEEIKKQEIKEEIRLPVIEEIRPEPKLAEKKIEVEKLKKVKTKTKDDFQDLIGLFVKQNQIHILEQKITRKNKEINMIVKLPSRIGTLNFYVKCKNKKIISNADLSLAYNEGQQKNLPILFLTTGKPTKKALEYIEKSLNNRLILKQIK